MQQIRHIFFDWGGVIADDPGDEFLADLLRSIGADEDQIREIYDSSMRHFMRGELTEADYWQSIRDDYGLDFHDSISEEFQHWKGLQVNHAVLQLADEARARGFRTAILSNVIEPTYNVLAGTGHFERFDAIIASCQIGYAKPQTEIYEIALQRLGASAKTSLFIDDKQRNLDPAAAMGFATILAVEPEQTIRDIAAYVRTD